VQPAVSAVAFKARRKPGFLKTGRCFCRELRQAGFSVLFLSSLLSFIFPFGAPRAFICR